MSKAYDQYKAKERELLLGREEGTMCESDEDDLLDSMDPLWWEMFDEERIQIRKETRIRNSTPQEDR